jgi:hypothetical protein
MKQSTALTGLGLFLLLLFPQAACGSDGEQGAGATGGTSGAGVGGSSAGNTGGNAPGAGGNAAGGASTGGGGAAGGAQPSATGGQASGGQATASGGQASGGQGSGGAGACAITAERVRVTEVDVAVPVTNNEDEATLAPLVLAPIPGGGSRLAFMSTDGKVHVAALAADDARAGDAVAFPAHDVADVYADAQGGVLLLSRDAQGGGTLNCGEPTNLCGTPPSPPIACYDMYLVRFDGANEQWATKLTSSDATLPPYSTGKTGADVTMIWWYAHHGRIASDGTQYAAYFGSAISVSQSGCINIHQGDRMKLVGANGALATGGFDWGCSHSGFERITYDALAKKFVTVCKTDNQNRIALAPNYKTIYPVDLSYSDLGDVVTGSAGGYWLTTSNIRTGQPAGAAGLADVHLLHFDTGAPDKDVMVANDAGKNARADHLVAYGASHLIAAWESSSKSGDLTRNDTGRALFVQTRDRATGDAQGAPLQVSVRGNRYQSFVAYPDGSVAFAAPGSSSTKVKILRILPCG